MFRFKQFTVRQEGAAMKVGTDGVLVGAWASAGAECRRILDIGTGTGLIALMAAQRFPSARVVGVEIDAGSAAQARENVAASEWGDRIDIVHSAVQEYMSDERFDLIISNPPYYDNSLVCPDYGRTAARHTVSLNFAELTTAAERLLADEGRFAVIVPTAAARSVIMATRLHLVRRCDVRTKPSGSSIRTMLEFAARFDGAADCSELTIGDGAGGYDEDYKRLTRDFYLKF